MCNTALVTCLWQQYWSAWLIKICEHRKTCIFCVLSLVKPTKMSWNLLKIWSWNFSSCSWEPCKCIYLLTYLLTYAVCSWRPCEAVFLKTASHRHQNWAVPVVCRRRMCWTMLFRVSVSLVCVMQSSERKPTISCCVLMRRRSVSLCACWFSKVK